MHLDAFLTLSELDGNSTDAQNEHQFEILTFHHGGFRQNTTAQTKKEEEIEASPWTHGEVTVMRPIDEHYCDFVKAICTGKKFKSAEIRSRSQIINAHGAGPGGKKLQRSQASKDLLSASGPAASGPAGDPFVLQMKDVVVTRVKYVINPVFHVFGRDREIPILPTVAEKLGPLMEVELMYYGDADYMPGT